VERSRTIGAYIAAIALAALTLSVFGFLRDYGPESALLRFHQAAIANQTNALQRVCKDKADSEAVEILKSRLGALSAQGAKIRMGLVHRETRFDRVNGETVKVSSVVTEVRYYAPGRIENIFWVIDHEPAGWMVNAYETVLFPVKRLGVGRPG
jgi:hypothetical protein